MTCFILPQLDFKECFHEHKSTKTIPVYYKMMDYTYKYVKSFVYHFFVFVFGIVFAILFAISDGKLATLYPPNTLYQICCGLMRALNWRLRSINEPEVNFFTNPIFSRFKGVLDSRMKELQSTGMHQVHKAQPISWGTLYVGEGTTR